MATYYLINRIKFSGNVLCPGTLLDSVSEDVTGIQAAGGVLVASSDPTIAAAAVQAQGARVNGAADQLVDTIMASAYVAYAISLASTIDASELGTGAVTETKIGAAAVTEAKIGTGAVTATKIGAGAVLTAAVGDGEVTAAKLANGAGIAALVTAGLGNSLVVDNDDADPSLLAADASNARACLVVAVVTETLAGAAAFSVESVGGTVLLAVTSGTAGDVLIGAGVVAAHATDSEVIVDATSGDTGAIAVTILALPTA